MGGEATSEQRGKKLKEPAGKRAPRKGGKAKAASVAAETEPHEQENDGTDLVTIATSDLEVMGSKLEGAKVGVMREAVGKGKVELAPIAILAGKEEHAPLSYQLGQKMKLDSETIRQKKPGLKKKRVFTNENIVADEFDYNASSEVSGAKDVLSIRADVDPCVRDLVSYLVTELGVKRTDKAQYLTSAPSVLGVSLEEVREKVRELEALGFTKKEVASIVPLFPSSVAMDWANVREIYQFLRSEVKMTKSVIHSLMKQHSFMFGVPYSRVSEL